MAEQSSIRLVYSASDTPATSPKEVSSSATIVELTAGSFSLPETRMDIDELYPSLEAVSPALRHAMQFLAAAGDKIGRAVEAHQEGNAVGADDAMQQLHAHLYDAFCQRELGDGYGAVINACMSAFENTRGAALGIRQIKVIGTVLAKLRNEPLLSFPQAVPLISALQSVRLKTDAPGVAEIADWLSGEPTAL